MVGGVRKAVEMMGTETSRADVTCTSLLRDINGMVWFPFQRKANVKLHGNLRGEMESGVTGCYFSLAVITYRSFTPRSPELRQATAAAFTVVS